MSKMMFLRDYFKTNYFERFDKVFLARNGNHCGYIICITPFSVNHYWLKKARIVFCLTSKFRPVFIEEYCVWRIREYLNNPPSNHFDRPPESDLVQYPSWISIVTTEMQIRKFILKQSASD